MWSFKQRDRNYKRPQAQHKQSTDGRRTVTCSSADPACAPGDRVLEGLPSELCTFSVMDTTFLPYSRASSSLPGVQYPHRVPAMRREKLRARREPRGPQLRNFHNEKRRELMDLTPYALISAWKDPIHPLNVSRRGTTGNTHHKYRMGFLPTRSGVQQRQQTLTRALQEQRQQLHALGHGLMVLSIDVHSDL